jgi:hypothetical protein
VISCLLEWGMTGEISNAAAVILGAKHMCDGMRGWEAGRVSNREPHIYGGPYPMLTRPCVGML